MGVPRLLTRSTRTIQTSWLAGPTERRKTCSRRPSGVQVSTTGLSRMEATLNLEIQLLETNLLGTNLPIPQQLPLATSIIPMEAPSKISMELNRTSRISPRRLHPTEEAWGAWAMEIDPMVINTNSTMMRSVMSMGECRGELFY
jgi:hypothetical protein